MTKKCSKCGEIKDEIEFRWRTVGHKKRVATCKVCDRKQSIQWARKNPQKMSAQRRRAREKRKEKFGLIGHQRYQRGSALKTSFGITLEQYDIMWTTQGGVCAICGKPEVVSRDGKLLSLAVDHDRQTGKVRALLCGNCNRAIGIMQHDPERLEKAAAYLRSFLGMSPVESIQDIFSKGVSG